MAQESEKDDEIIDAMSQLINDCTFGKVDAKTCPMFDAEYIFLKLRAKKSPTLVNGKILPPGF